jgi:hypothetical protein
MSTAKDKPNALVMAKNAMVAGVKVAKRVVTGKTYKVTGEILNKRLSTCFDCEFFISEDNSCAKCGCPVHAKCGLATESCPEGKWSEIEPQVAAETYRGGIVTGSAFLDKELELREILPGDSKLVDAINRYRRVENEGGCTSCRANKFYKEFEVQLSRDLAELSVEEISAIYELWPGTTYISLSAPFRWDEILANAASRA